MSVEVRRAYGIFEADDSPYKTTALQVIKKMPDFYGTDNYDKASVLLDAF
jgi:hypothetical protein